MPDLLVSCMVGIRIGWVKDNIWEVRFIRAGSRIGRLGNIFLNGVFDFWAFLLAWGILKTLPVAQVFGSCHNLLLIMMLCEPEIIGR